MALARRGIPAVEVIATGTELLIGGVVETNSLFLADALLALGLELRWKTVVGDDPAAIAQALRAAARRSAVTILLGGLGATEDDHTRNVVARVAGRPLARRAGLLPPILARYRGRGVAPPPGVEALVDLPRGARVIPNPVGSAPGFALALGRARLVCLPGVPPEMEAMFTASVRPWLAGCFRGARPILLRLVRSYGLSEGEVNRRLLDLFRRDPAAVLGLRAVTQTGGVDVRLRVGGLPAARARALAVLVTDEIRRRLGDAVYTVGRDGLETVVAGLLLGRKQRLALAESCTGGLIGHRLTNVPGSSGFLDSVVSYSDRSKLRLLGVPAETLARHGAVSPETVSAMAEGARRAAGADLGLAVSGIAGPGGGTAAKPVGLVQFALAAADGVATEARTFRGNREAIKWHASQFALDLLRRHLEFRGHPTE
jgi:nicotinamide-nucleotide amidase